MRGTFHRKCSGVGRKSFDLYLSHSHLRWVCDQCFGKVAQMPKPTQVSKQCRRPKKRVASNNGARKSLFIVNSSTQSTLPMVNTRAGGALQPKKRGAPQPAKRSVLPVAQLSESTLPMMNPSTTDRIQTQPVAQGNVKGKAKPRPKVQGKRESGKLVGGPATTGSMSEVLRVLTQHTELLNSLLIEMKGGSARNRQLECRVEGTL